MEIVRLIAKGETVAELCDELKELTFTTGNEHAVVSLNSGERVLVRGEQYSITFEPGDDVRRIIVHTHVYEGEGTTTPSDADVEAITALGQHSSYLQVRGQTLRFWSKKN